MIRINLFASRKQKQQKGKTNRSCRENRYHLHPAGLPAKLPGGQGGQSISIIIMSTPFINFGGYGSSLCRARTMCVSVSRFWWLGWVVIPRPQSTAASRELLQKIPTPARKKAVAKDQDGRTAYHSEGREREKLWHWPLQAQSSGGRSLA
ncbi:hypothetical protein J3E68DRAFT_252031 [Trichoderma sp. SZMC 28012]